MRKPSKGNSKGRSRTTSRSTDKKGKAGAPKKFAKPQKESAAGTDSDKPQRYRPNPRSNSKAKAPKYNDPEEIRLNKYISNAGIWWGYGRNDGVSSTGNDCKHAQNI